MNLNYMQITVLRDCISCFYPDKTFFDRFNSFIREIKFIHGICLEYFCPPVHPQGLGSEEHPGVLQESPEDL